MSRKNLNYVLCVLIIMSILVSHVYALPDYAGGNKTQYIPLEEQIKTILSNPNLSDEQRQWTLTKYENKLRSEKSLTAEKTTSPVTRAAYVLFVPFCEQTTWYYCGPATTQQTYYYLNNKINGINYAPTQDQLASILHTDDLNGTDINCMVGYLNNTFNLDYVITWWWSSASSMANDIHQALEIDVRPTILRFAITDTTGTNWRFPTGGHYVNIEGYTTAGTYNIVDPYKDGHNISTGKYAVTINDIFTYHVLMAY